MPSFIPAKDLIKNTPVTAIEVHALCKDRTWTTTEHDVVQYLSHVLQQEPFMLTRTVSDVPLFLVHDGVEMPLPPLVLGRIDFSTFPIQLDCQLQTGEKCLVGLKRLCYEYGGDTLLSGMYLIIEGRSDGQPLLSGLPGICR